VCCHHRRDYGWDASNPPLNVYTLQPRGEGVNTDWSEYVDPGKVINILSASGRLRMTRVVIG
jgi:hypothetical protein